MRFGKAPQRQETKADLCHPAIVAEGQWAAHDKIVPYWDIGRATIEPAVAVVEAAEEEPGLYGCGVLSRCARNRRRIGAL
jgi:hypothetical protein